MKMRKLMNNDPNNPNQQDPNQFNQPPYIPNQFNQPPYDPNQPYLPYQPYQQPMYASSPIPNQQNQPPKKNAWRWYKRQKNGTKLGVGCLAIIGVLVLCGLCSAVSNGASSTQATAVAASPTATQHVAQALTPTATPVPKPTPKPTATPKPKPTASPAQVEESYKAGTTDTTVSDVDKEGNVDQYKNVHVICTILAFVKDDSGNTAGANVSDPNDLSSIIQIEFTPGTDITQLNANDTLEVWGLDAGVSSGTNAFGGTVQESAVQAIYMNDQTTGYQANS
jgi:cytoskeletal protein RodZ